MAQVNVVVPAQHADLVRRVGKALREIDGFADALGQFLDGEAAIPEVQRRSLARQVADAVIAAVVPALTAARPAAPEAPRKLGRRKRPSGQFDMDL